MKRKVQFQLGGDRADFDIEGETGYGGDVVLFEQDDNLIERMTWRNEGYSVVPFLDAANGRLLREGIRLFLQKIVETVTERAVERFSLERYHEFLPEGDATHLRIVEKFRDVIPLEAFPIDPKLVYGRVSQVLGIPVSGPKHVAGGFSIRVVRPDSGDNNPPHRDVWLDRLRNAVNIYVPIAGSNARSSLPLVPGSHLWKESEIERTLNGATVGKLRYSVPSVTSAKRPMIFVRPDPGLDEMVLFTPYLIHGGAKNFNRDKTRVSLEMRFWRA